MPISGERSTIQRGNTDGWRRLIDLLDDAQSVGRLGATFQAAVEFGIAPKEILATIVEVSNRASVDGDASDPFEELSAALASKILADERSAHSPS